MSRPSANAANVANVAEIPPALSAFFESVHIQDVPADGSPEQAQRLALFLRDLLYSRCFSRPAQRPRVVPAPGAPAPVPGLAGRLSAANRGRDAWLPGWRVEEVGLEGAVVLSRGASRRTVRPGDYALTWSEDLPPRTGCAATLCHRKESLTLQAGVYYAFGGVLPAPGEERGALRIYLHAAQDSAVPVFATLTAGLNALEVPFTLKSMLRPEDQDRSDATLLYLPTRFFPAFAGLLRRVAVSLCPYLTPGAPLFTKPLAEGMGLAESPDTGESFGMHRCRLVAEGIVDAWRDGRQDAASRWRGVESRFTAAGLSLARPYLNPGSEDIYGADIP